MPGVFFEQEQLDEDYGALLNRPESFIFRSSFPSILRNLRIISALLSHFLNNYFIEIVVKNPMSGVQSLGSNSSSANYWLRRLGRVTSSAYS